VDVPRVPADALTRDLTGFRGVNWPPPLQQRALIRTPWPRSSAVANLQEAMAELKTRRTKLEEREKAKK
jgi:hypothetical protein